jgi:hypothetical protein
MDSLRQKSGRIDGASAKAMKTAVESGTFSAHLGLPGPHGGPPGHLAHLENTSLWRVL